MATKDAHAGRRIRFIEGLLTRLERERKNAEGADKDALQELKKRALRELQKRRLSRGARRIWRL